MRLNTHLHLCAAQAYIACQHLLVTDHHEGKMSAAIVNSAKHCRRQFNYAPHASNMHIALVINILTSVTEQQPRHCKPQKAHSLGLYAAETLHVKALAFRCVQQGKHNEGEHAGMGAAKRDLLVSICEAWA